MKSLRDKVIEKQKDQKLCKAVATKITESEYDYLYSMALNRIEFMSVIVRDAVRHYIALKKDVERRLKGQRD